MVRKYGYLGPEGTHCEEALHLFTESDIVEKQPFPGIEHVITAVISGEVNHGIIPLENSIEGTVNQALDLLASGRELKIVGEVILPIKHNLLVKAGTAKDCIRTILSHPQALAQCRAYIKQNLPEAMITEVNSTAEAARIVAEGGVGLAAIANDRAAEKYRLNIIEGKIQDCGENRTRFVVISKDEVSATGLVKTSVVISITDRPGGLYQILKEFALANINLTKIESRPAKTSLGDYLFFIDLIGHRDDPIVRRALDAIRNMAASFHILGTYHTWQEKNTTSESAANQERREISIDQIRQDIDIIDYQIVELLARRTEMVSLIGNLKNGRPSYRDQGREMEVLHRVKNNALKKGVSPELVEDIYNALFRHFVGLQESLQNQYPKSLKQGE